MANENNITPTGNGGSSLRDAETRFATLMSDVDDGADTHEVSETEEGEAEQAELEHEEEQQESEGGETPEGEEGSDPEEEEGEEERTGDLDDNTPVALGEEEISLGELKRGYLRQQDYTRKTQAVAEERRQHETAAAAELNNLRTERQKLHEELDKVGSYLQELMPEEPDWTRLYQENPAEYAAQRELWRSWQEQIAGIGQRQQQLRMKQQGEMADMLRKEVETEKGRLLEAIPEWTKPEVAKVEKRKILDWGQKNGYTEAELNSIVDHRALVVARKAMLYDEMVAAKKNLRQTPTKGNPKPARPQAASTSPKKDLKLNRARERLAKSGRVADATALFDQYLAREE